MLASQHQAQPLPYEGHGLQSPLGAEGRPGSLSSDDDMLSIHPSEGSLDGLAARVLADTDMGSERSRDLVLPPSVPAPQPVETATPAPELVSRSAREEAELYPQPPRVEPLPTREVIATILDELSALPGVTLEDVIPPAPTVHRRRLLAPEGPSAEPTDSVRRFPLEGSVGDRLQAWRRTPARDWTSFSKDLDRLIRVSDQDYQAHIRVPPISSDVFDLLRSTQEGASRAPAGDGGRGKLRDSAAQRREDTLKALDRSLRSAVKYQSLVIWAAECLTARLDSHPEVSSQVTPLLRGLAGMADATIEQLARASARVGTERRENLFPLMRLSEATTASLRRLPYEGPDLFAGHFGDVVSRQAKRQDDLRKTRRLVERAHPPSAPPSRPSSRGGRSPASARGRKRKRSGGSGRGSKGPAPHRSGQVTVSRGGGRTFTDGPSTSKAGQRF